MKPEWRTSTVVGICTRIRDTRDYSALPILADALQDANCDDEELLTGARNTELSEVQAERIVAIVYSEKTENAVKWMEEFASKCGQQLVNAEEQNEWYRKYWDATEAHDNRMYEANRRGELIPVFDYAAIYAARPEPVYRDITYEDVMSAGHAYHFDRSYFVQRDSERARDMMNKEMSDKYWDAWSDITDLEIPNPEPGFEQWGLGTAPFSCSC